MIAVHIFCRGSAEVPSASPSAQELTRHILWVRTGQYVGGFASDGNQRIDTVKEGPGTDGISATGARANRRARVRTEIESDRRTGDRKEKGNVADRLQGNGLRCGFDRCITSRHLVVFRGLVAATKQSRKSSPLAGRAESTDVHTGV